MTRTRYRIFENEQEYPYFMTCTVVGWLPVFTRPQTVDIVLNSWRHLQQHNQFLLFGYVILENHLHLIARSGCSLGGIRRVAMRCLATGAFPSRSLGTRGNLHASTAANSALIYPTVHARPR